MVTEIWFNAGSDNGLMPDITMPLPEAMLTNHQWGLVAFTGGQFHQDMLKISILKTLRLRQNGHLLPDDIFKCIFLNENVWILIKISLKFVPMGPCNHIPALVHIMAWHQPSDKPLSEPMMVSLLMHMCITWPQWVNMSLKITNLTVTSPSY